MDKKRPDGLNLNRLWWLLPAAAAGWLFYLLRPVLTPFLFAVILAYICNPLVERMVRLKIPRTLGTLLAMALLYGVFAALLLVMVPLFEKQVELFLERLPGYLDWFRQHLAPWLKARFDLDLRLDADYLKHVLSEHWQGAGGLATQFLPSLTSGGIAVVGFLANLVLLPVVLFYVLRDWNVLVADVDEFIPRRWHRRVGEVAREVDEVLAGFLRGQLLVILLMCMFYSLGLWVAGLELALPIGIVAGTLVFVPYLGAIVGLALATLAGLMQFQSFGAMIPVWVVFGLGQTLEGTVVTPWLVGDRIGLHPLAVIFAVLAFGQLFGFFGVLLALPASAALLVGLRILRKSYLDSGLYR
ncbi:MAG: AI-2E family transporter [Sulfuricella sp.]|nr:AI-2E family transporter [Sulfuricella sp.]